MTQGRSRAGDAFGSGRFGGGRFGGARGYRLTHFALAALLIVAAAAFLRGGLPPIGLDGPYAHDQLPVAIALEVVIIALLIVVIVRRAKASADHLSPDHLLATRLREVLRATLIVAALAVPAGYLLTRNIHLKLRPLRLRPLPSRPYQHRPHGAAGSRAVSFGTWFDLLLAAVLVAAIVGCAIFMLRRRRSRGRGRGRGRAWLPVEEPAFPADSEAELRKALEYGWLALRELDDARGAIIACYLAMEQSLAQAGAARGVAETPSELLARAAAAGLVRGTAAARLTSVFYAARFSTMELTVADRETAEQALTELTESLTEGAR
jgi:hypothetical protein